MEFINLCFCLLKSSLYPLWRITSAILSKVSVLKIRLISFSDARNPFFTSAKISFEARTSKRSFIFPSLYASALSQSTRISKTSPSFFSLAIIDRSIITRLKKDGEVFEILVDCDKALAYREGKIKDLLEVLASKEIFADVKKGLRASEKEIKRIFKT